MTTRILFNEDCPICNAEICHYQKYAEANDIELYFDKLGKTCLLYTSPSPRDTA